ncbi:MAG: hypothetical protein JWQ18_1561 [Conexibacter sp.]|nr:hypothetical protein [Conexibacter sp.]
MRAVSNFTHRFVYPCGASEFGDRVVVDYIAPKLGKGNMAMVRYGADGAEFERLHRSDWVFVACVLLFPIGLLALLAPKKREFVAFRWTPRADEHCDVTVHGQGSKGLAANVTGIDPERIRREIDAAPPA